VSADLLPLRDYQRQAIDAVFRAHADGMRRPAVVLSTGAGKTVIFSHMASEFHARTGRRVLVLVHRDELADQALAKLRAIAPHLSAGKVKAGENQVDAHVVVASVQTIVRPARMASLLESQQRYRSFGLVITDEAHHGVAPSYQRIYAALPDAVHAGFTATMARGDGIGLGSVWEDVVYTKSLAYMISKGYLVQPVGRSVAVDDLDLSAVKQSRGDYQSGSLGSALEESHALAQIAAAYRAYAADRPGVVFTPTVATAHGAAKELEALGLRSAVVTGETPRDERRRIFADYAARRVQVLANCMVLTEGWDAPLASCAVIARPTASQPLYVQMVGRVLRPFPGKADALVLDVVGASETNKLATLVDLEEGLFPERKPCRTCWEVPCVCPCKGCGGPKPCRACVEEEGSGAAADLVLKGTGAAIDLFASSRSAWLQTRRGVWFIPTGDSHVVLWPQADGAWTVADVPKAGAWQRLHEGVDLEAAMSWGEVEAEDRDDGPFGFIANRGASWRWRKTAPSQAQLDKAARLRIVHAPDVTKAELSDMISVAVASRLIDPYVPAPQV
jgi:superfamily II DNA or RNA helicase